MENYSNTDDIEHIFSKIEAPTVNLVDGIMDKAYNKSTKVNTKLKFSKKVSIVFLLSFFLFSSISINATEIKSIVDIFNKLKPGETVSVPDDKGVFVNIKKPIVVNKIEDLEARVSNYAISIDKLPKTFNFTEAHIGYKTTNINNSSDIGGYSILYTCNKQTISLSITIAKNPIVNYSTTDSEGKIYSRLDRVMVNGEEGFFAVYEFGSKYLTLRNGIGSAQDLGGYKKVHWIYNNNFLMTLTASGDTELTKSDMISIAESIKMN